MGPIKKKGARSFLGKKQKNMKKHNNGAYGDYGVCKDSGVTPDYG